MADGAWLETFSSRRTPCLSKHGMVSCTQHAAAQAGQGNRCGPLGYERVDLPLCQVADTPFHIQGDAIMLPC